MPNLETSPVIKGLALGGAIAAVDTAPNAYANQDPVESPALETVIDSPAPGFAATRSVGMETLSLYMAQNSNEAPAAQPASEQQRIELAAKKDAAIKCARKALSSTIDLKKTTAKFTQTSPTKVRVKLRTKKTVNSDPTCLRAGRVEKIDAQGLAVPKRDRTLKRAKAITRRTTLVDLKKPSQNLRSSYSKNLHINKKLASLKDKYKAGAKYRLTWRPSRELLALGVKLDPITGTVDSQGNTPASSGSSNQPERGHGYEWLKDHCTYEVMTGPGAKNPAENDNITIGYEYTPDNEWVTYKWYISEDPEIGKTARFTGLVGINGDYKRFYPEPTTLTRTTGTVKYKVGQNPEQPGGVLSTAVCAE